MAVRDRDPETVAEASDELGRVDPVRRPDRGDDRRAVVVGREELEPHRLCALAARAPETDVSVEHGLEAGIEQHAKGDVEAGDERDRRRERRVERGLRLPGSLPVEIEAGRFPTRGPRALGGGEHRQAGRRHQRLLRAGDDHVETPGVRLERDGPEARDRVDDGEGTLLAGRCRDRLQVADDAGRGLRVGEKNCLRAAELLQAAGDVVGGRNLAPGVLERLHLGAVRGGDRAPALAELPGGDDEHALARRAQVRHCGLHRAAPRRAEKQHIAPGAEDLAQACERSLVDRPEVGAPVMHDRL